MKNRIIIMTLVITTVLAGWSLSISDAASHEQVVRVGSEVEFPPFATIDENGQAAGFSIDLIKAVAEVVDLRLVITTGPWDLMWNSLIEGRLDVLPIVAKLPERQNLVDFSIPHTETFDTFFVRDGTPVIQSIAAAQGKKIVVMKSDAAHHALLERKFQGEIITVDTIPEGLKLAASGRYDAFLCSKLIGMLEIKEHGIKGVKAGPLVPDYKRVFSFGVKRGSDELRRKLDEGLMIVKSSGEYERIYSKWFGFDDPWQKYRKYLIIAVFVTVVIALIAVFWLAMLRRTVRRRTAELAAKNVALEAEITARKKAEEDLRIQRENQEAVIRERYLSYIDVTRQIAWTTSAQGEVVDDLPAWRSYTGQTFEEIKGWGWSKALHPDDLEETSRVWKQSLADRASYETEYRIRRNDGVYRHFLARGIPLSEKDGQIREWVGTCVDITTIREAEDALKRSHDELDHRVRERTRELAEANTELEHEIRERWKTEKDVGIVNTLLKLFVQKMTRKEYLDETVKVLAEWSGCSHVGIRNLDEAGNMPYEAYIGFDQQFIRAEAILPKNSDQCLCVRVVTGIPDAQDRSFMTANGSFFCNNTYEFLKSLTDAGKLRYSGACIQSGFRSVAIVPVRYHEKVQGVIHFADEREGMVSPGKVKFAESVAPILGEAIYRFNAEIALRTSREDLRDLTAYLQAVREEERTSVAREIHDELGQILTALKMDVSWIHGKYRDHQVLADKTLSMLEMIDTTIQTVRRIITELRPGILDHLGISAAMEWQIEEFTKKYGIRCDIACIPEDIVLDRDISINLFRIFQEVLTNIARHSGASTVDVLFEQTGDQIILNVEDDGKGIMDDDASRPKSFGILGIRERVNFMGGSVSIQGRPGKGTSINVTVPVRGRTETRMPGFV